MQDYIVPNMVRLLNVTNDISNDDLESMAKVSHDDSSLNNNQIKSRNSKYVANSTCWTFLNL